VRLEHNFASFAEARTAIIQWIECYNAERPDQALRYRSPRQFRALHFNTWLEIGGALQAPHLQPSALS
jgi:hypothetical protein